MPRFAISKFLVLGAAAAVLAACGSTRQPPATFELSPPPPAQTRRASTRAQILIPEPTATKTLDSQQIVVKPTAQTVEYLGDSQWTDRLPRLVQLRLLQGFQNTGRVGAAGVPGQGLAIDYQVVMEVRRFEMALTPSPTAIVEISAKVLNDRTGQVRATRIFRGEQAARGTGNAAYVEAIDDAFGSVADEIVAWTIGLV
ncbi:ABC-type transport auxiliary lipoprotein family protein [Aureimonas jatrophae]|jgi:cholesterol transport system auxiliary component|uniref:Cholesterol transport system auxiliary component n=1 Tax=Aureimonas jatrophae TaxID=1166073 RepID=A0A1H0GHW1_9HYPH|nr:ABC-type transport auxiliary lipoprotein family protein [Aureimonas jatrophae]MBB3949582.1 cholesterol transport system auxiliary component [Aureimonas jatrophae]SDO06545.1 cholesterol transport system auxiliary component [Aureimonas jatrophae]